MPLLKRNRSAEIVLSPVSEVLPRSVVARRPAEDPRDRAGSGFFSTCANPACTTGWLQIWRSRSTPVFEGGWNCSPACTLERLETAVARELDGRGTRREQHQHRVPLGLLMLEQGWITPDQLRRALEGQRTHKAGRLGQWLVVREGVSERQVTRALGLQWSCPVISLEACDSEGMAAVMPRLFVDAFGALPLRVAAGRLLYLGFEERPDPVLALAIERMSGLQVERGLVEGTRFRAAHQRMLDAAFPSLELVEAASAQALVRTLGRAIERTRPVESRLVRVHDCLWLRMWRRPQTGPLPDGAAVTDIVATLGS